MADGGVDSGKGIMGSWFAQPSAHPAETCCGQAARKESRSWAVTRPAERQLSVVGRRLFIVEGMVMKETGSLKKVIVA